MKTFLILAATLGTASALAIPQRIQEANVEPGLIARGRYSPSGPTGAKDPYFQPFKPSGSRIPDEDLEGPSIPQQKEPTKELTTEEIIALMQSKNAGEKEEEKKQTKSGGRRVG